MHQLCKNTKLSASLIILGLSYNSYSREEYAYGNNEVNIYLVASYRDIQFDLAVYS